jgi:protein phosphatase
LPLQEGRAPSEEKHMGSRAIIVLCRTDAVARLRFGTTGTETGAIWTRTGRAFFSDSQMTEAVLGRLRTAMDRLSLWEQLETDWLLLDAEIMPWSAKAGSLIESQYAPVAVSSRAGLHAAIDALARASSRGVPSEMLAQNFADRAARATAYAAAWEPYVWPGVWRR